MRVLRAERFVRARRGSRLASVGAVLLLVVVSGCRSTGYERAAAERFDGPVTFTPNAAGSHVLAVEERSPGPGVGVGTALTELRYFVYDTAGDSIAYERASAFRGSVQWHGEHRLRVEETPGAVRRDDTRPNVYYIDTRTGRRVDGASGVEP